MFVLDICYMQFLAMFLILWISFCNAFLSSCFHTSSTIVLNGHDSYSKYTRSYTYSKLNRELFVRLSGSSYNDDESVFNMEELSNRINRIREGESLASDMFELGISKRLEELRSSQLFEDQMDKLDIVSVPVICLDALLPGQKLEGTTEDPTFCIFLREVGLGGWFAMTSLDFRSRKMRRNGVLCKIEFVDAASKDENKDFIPTAVDFVIHGKRRCRLVGPAKGMKSRIGRWRRCYDENGEESVLGWGEERFLDLPESDSSPYEGLIKAPSDNFSNEHTSWNTIEVKCNVESDQEINDEMIEKAQSLLPLLNDWYALASNTETYVNTNVTATARIEQDKPLLSIDPKKFLNRINEELGPCPPVTEPSLFAFWVAALINPLPPMGVSLEIRGQMLESKDILMCLQILERGLKRSIENLNGTKPL